MATAVEYTGGRYSMKFDMPEKETYVRVEAPGYEPAESRGFRPDEGAMIQDFRLKPAAGISGVVLLPDGRPAAGVQVVLGTQENRAFVRGGVVQRQLECREDHHRTGRPAHVSRNGRIRSCSSSRPMRGSPTRHRMSSRRPESLSCSPGDESKAR